MSSSKFKSGIWEGFYMLNGKKQNVTISMNFRPKHEETMEGEGSDDILGEFAVKGKYSEKAPYPCSFTFEFASNGIGKMDFNGWRESDKGGMFGTWKGVVAGSGSFAIYPSKQDSDAALRLKAKANETNKGQLLSMGFPDWLVDQALNETSGLEPAINWITEQLSKGASGGGQVADTEVNDNVDESSLQQLLSMGFDEGLAIQALQINKTVEAAANWLFDRT